MPVAKKLQKSTERVVVLLRSSERKRLRELAKAESVSAAEILRRSLAAYDPESEREVQSELAKLNEAIDRNLALAAESRKRIDASRADLEKLRLPAEVDAYLEQLYREALAQQANKRSVSVQNRRSKAA